MKKSEVTIGRVYTTKIDGKMVSVRLQGENPNGGWDGVNLTTGKKIHIKLPRQLLREVNVPEAKAGDMDGAAETAESEPSVSGPPPETDTRAPEAATGADRRPKTAKKSKATKTTIPAKRAKRGQTTAKPPTGLDAAARVLEESKGPMACREIVKMAFEKGYWKSDGKTPHATIYSAMIREIAARGEQSRFEKVQRGEFAINSQRKAPTDPSANH